MHFFLLTMWINKVFLVLPGRIRCRMPPLRRLWSPVFKVISSQPPEFGCAGPTGQGLLWYSPTPARDAMCVLPTASRWVSADPTGALRQAEAVIFVSTKSKSKLKETETQGFLAPTTSLASDQHLHQSSWEVGGTGAAAGVGVYLSWAA